MKVKVNNFVQIEQLRSLCAIFMDEPFCFHKICFTMDTISNNTSKVVSLMGGRDFKFVGCTLRICLFICLLMYFQMCLQTCFGFQFVKTFFGTKVFSCTTILKSTLWTHYIFASKTFQSIK